MNAITLSELLLALKDDLSDYPTLQKRPAVSKNQIFLKFPNDPRMIISTQKSTNLPLDREASGVIVDTTDWSIIARPPLNIHKVLTTSTIESIESLQDYDAYEVRDGTIVTLYWYGNRWAIATKKSLNMFSNVWMGRKRYSAIFRECLAAAIPKAGQVSAPFDMFDKGWSYTIGFCHPEHHPAENAPAAWLISAYRRETQDIFYGNTLRDESVPNPGLPIYEPIDANVDVISRHEQLNGTPEYCGFILRGKDAYDPLVPAIICKSESLITREKMFYNIIGCMPNTQKIKYAAVMSLREPRGAEEFVKTFPKLVPAVKAARKAIDSISSDIHSRMVLHSGSSDGFASDMAREILTSKQINPAGTSAVSLIRDIVISKIQHRHVLDFILKCMN
jgi:hypothetical protein